MSSEKMCLYLDEDGILVEASTFEFAPTSVKLAALPKQSNKKTVQIRHSRKKKTVRCGTKMCEQCWGHLGNCTPHIVISGRTRRSAEKQPSA